MRFLPFQPVRLLPSMTDMAFAMPLVYLFGVMNGARSLLGDGDTGWHIRTGEWILDHGRVPDRDLFSFTRPQAPWLAWEWLWDAVCGWLHRNAGMAAVVLASVAVIALTWALLYRLVRRSCGNVFLAITVTLAAAAAASIHWLARPHLVTTLAAVLFLIALERAREGRTAALWLLPPATVLWVNLHGGFIVGIALAALYAAGALLERGWRAARPFAWAAAGCALASLCNPYGWRLHAHLWQYLADPRYYEGIQEFQSISFHAGLSRFFEVLLVSAAAAAFWSLRRRRFTDALLALAWAHLALYAARNIPLFAVVSAPVVARALAEWLHPSAAAPGWRRCALERFRAAAAGWGALDRLPRWHAASALVLAVVAAGLWAGTGEKFRAEYDPKRYPARAVERLRGPEFAHSVFTHDEWGDYLIYRLYPAVEVFVDGRSDFYGAALEEEYGRVLKVRHDWESILRRYGVDTVLLPPDAALAGALKESRRWRLTYDDGVALIFRANFSAAAERGGFRRDRGVPKLITRAAARDVCLRPAPNPM